MENMTEENTGKVDRPGGVIKRWHEDATCLNTILSDGMTFEIYEGVFDVVDPLPDGNTSMVDCLNCGSQMVVEEHGSEYHRARHIPPRAKDVGIKDHNDVMIICFCSNCCEGVVVTKDFYYSQHNDYQEYLNVCPECGSKGGEFECDVCGRKNCITCGICGKDYVGDEIIEGISTCGKTGPICSECN